MRSRSSPTLGRALDARVARVDSSHLALTVTPAGSTVTVPLADITRIESYGGRVELVDLVAGRSTTNIIRKISGS